MTNRASARARQYLTIPVVARALIPVLCLFHMAAVTAYLLPPQLAGIRMLKQATEPYILRMSQWQKWDIFAPNPLRRVSVYRIEITRNGTDTVKIPLNSKSLPWYEQVKDMKILGRFQEGWKPLVPAYLSSYCKEHTIHSPSVRLVATHYTIPLRSEALLTGWREHRQYHYEEVIASTSCLQS